MQKFSFGEWLAVILVLCFAMALRGAGMGDFGRLNDEDYPSYAPDAQLHFQSPIHPDEYFLVAYPVEMRLQDRWNPGFFEYPSGLMYLNMLVFSTGSREAIETEARQGDDLRTYAPFSFYFIARLWSVLGGVLTVACSYAVMRRVAGRYAAIFAALLIASSYLLVQHAHYSKPEIPSAGMMSLSLWAMMMALYSPSSRNRFTMLFLAGISCGAAATFRYNAVAISISLFFVSLVFLYRHFSRQSLLMVFLSWALVPIVFLLGSPFVLLDFPEFYRQFSYISSQYLSAATNILPELITSPAEGFLTLSQYLFQMGTGFLPALLIVVGIVVAWRERPAWRNFLSQNSKLLFVVLLLVHVVAYILVTFRSVRPFSGDNLLVLIVPQWLLVAALGMDWLYRKLSRYGYGIAAFSVAAILASQLIFTLPMASLFPKTDSRILMQQWIYQHIPEGSSFLLLEPYNIPLDEALYPFDLNFNLLRVDLNNLQTYDYLVLSLSRLEALSNFELVTDAELEPWLAQYHAIDAALPRLAWIESPVFMGSELGMNSLGYWHHPTLILYCINESLCSEN